jgi:hypothetical protein
VVERTPAGANEAKGIARRQDLRGRHAEQHMLGKAAKPDCYQFNSSANSPQPDHFRTTRTTSYFHQRELPDSLSISMFVSQTANRAAATPRSTRSFTVFSIAI